MLIGVVTPPQSTYSLYTLIVNMLIDVVTPLGSVQEYTPLGCNHPLPWVLYIYIYMCLHANVAFS